MRSRKPNPHIVTYHQTTNDLPEEVREQVVELSNQHLVDVLDFSFQGNQAHWNKTPSPSNS